MVTTESKKVASIDKFLIVRCGIGDVKVIPAAAVVFRVDPIGGIGEMARILLRRADGSQVG